MQLQHSERDTYIKSIRRITVDFQHGDIFASLFACTVEPLLSWFQGVPLSQICPYLRMHSK